MLIAICRVHCYIQIRLRQGGFHEVIRDNRREECHFHLYFARNIQCEYASGRGVLEGFLVHIRADVQWGSHPDIADVVDSDQTCPASDRAAARFSAGVQMAPDVCAALTPRKLAIDQLGSLHCRHHFQLVAK